MWGFDAARSGASPAAAELSETLHLQWVRELPSPRRAWAKQWDDADKLEFDLSYSPIVMDGSVFVASMRTDSVTSYDAESGAKNWRFFADGPVRLAPAGWDGKIFFVSDDGHLYCVDASDGDLLWKFNGAPAANRVLGNERIISMWAARGGPVVKDGTVYFASGVWPFVGTFVYALNAETGGIRWANTGHSTEWQAQPHGGAYSFAGVAPQGYLAAQGDRLVVSGGRSFPALFDRSDGTMLRSRVRGPKREGGYRVRIQGDYFYNHGLRYCIETGAEEGTGTLQNDYVDVLWERVNDVEDQLCGPVFDALTAGGFLFVTTETGALYCFGEHQVPPQRYNDQPSNLASPAEEWNRWTSELTDELSETEGYALFLGAGSGDLLRGILTSTELHAVVVESDTESVRRLREELAGAGLYGCRAAVIQADPAEFTVKPYLFSMVIAENLEDAGINADSNELGKILDRLRPYGGLAFLGISQENQDTFHHAAQTANVDQVSVEIQDNFLLARRDGPLTDTDQWTHQYGSSANTTFSRDKKVRPPFAPLWFGGPGHDNIVPRHSQGPVPQIAGGRMILPGVETLSARCVYTGRSIWVREFPGIGHPFTNLELEEKWSEGEEVYMTNLPGANFIGSPFVTLPDGVYVRYQGQIKRLDPDTGATALSFPVSEKYVEREEDWGHISVSGDVLLATGEPLIHDDEPLGGINFNAVSSRLLIAFDRHSGEKLWSAEAGIGFRHNAIVSCSERVYVIDNIAEMELEKLERRGQAPDKDQKLLAFDLHSGEELWQVTGVGFFGTWLSYSEQHEILFQSGRGAGKRTIPKEDHWQRIYAHCGRSGEIVWQRETDTAHLALVADMIIPGHPVYGWAKCIETGQMHTHRHFLTGEERSWRYSRTYGCNTFNTSAHMLLFRTGSAGYTDLTDDSGTATLGGFRAGCTNNLVAADGVLNAPDYTRTCTCSYQNQTSLGLIHSPDMEMWTFNEPMRLFEGSIRQVGINLGAPGDRLSENGIYWIHMPRRAPSPEVDVWLSTVDCAMDKLHVANAFATQRIPQDWRSRMRMTPNVGHSSLRVQNTLDGDLDSEWRIHCERKGDFDAELEYELSRTVELESIKAAWQASEKTHFTLYVSRDREQWHSVYEGTSEGSGKGYETYVFEPVEAQHVRMRFGEHGGEEESRERLQVFQVRLGDICEEGGYTLFKAPEDRFFRRHSLFVDGEDGPNWVAASGLTGIRDLVVPGVENGNFDIIFHFAEHEELEAGQRSFDVLLNGQMIAENFDIVKAAGGDNKSVTLRVEGIQIENGTLRLHFQPSGNSDYPPLLGGLEIIKK